MLSSDLGPARYEWRGSFANQEVNALHAEAFEHRLFDDDWNDQRLIDIARDESATAGCEWLHVDFEDHLKSFYFDACGFVPTNAGLIKLR